MLHQKKQDETQQETIEQVDRGIEELQTRIAKLTNEKHELGADYEGGVLGAH